MIAIVNVGPHDDPNAAGWRNYEVRINHEVIATFRHKRERGLARCLQAASDAVIEKQERERARVFAEWRKADMGDEKNGKVEG